MQIPGNPLRYLTSCAANLIFLLVLWPSPARSQNIDLVDLPNASGCLLKNNFPNSVRSNTAAYAGDFNGDGIADLVIGSPLADYNSRAYIVFGRSDIADTFDLHSVDDTANAQAFCISSNRTEIGFDVSTAGDFNGDGYDDVLLTTWRGIAYVVFGGPNPQPNRDLTTINSSTTWAVKFTIQYMSFIKAMSIGDVNGDGCHDIAISTRESNFPAQRAWVIFGSSTRHGLIDLADFQTSDENGYLFPNTTLGEISPVGDFNGDGYADFLVLRGTSGYYHTIILGKSSGFSDLSFAADGPENSIKIVADSYSWLRISPAGSVGISSDFNNDGYSDIVIGGFDYSGNRGTGYVLYGRDDASTSILLADVPTSPSLGFSVVGLPGEKLGESSTSVGDVNADGYADFVMDTLISYNDLTNAGSSYVIFGNNHTSGTINLETDFVPGQTGFRVDGPLEPENDERGYFSASAGDVNNDGIAEMLFSSMEYDRSISNTRGYNYVVFGRSPSAGVTNWQQWEPRTTRVRH